MFPIDPLKVLDDNGMPPSIRNNSENTLYVLPTEEITFQDSYGRSPKEIFEEGLDEWLEFEHEGNLTGARLLFCILSIPVLFLLLVLAMVL